jgi:hypothetical protein
MTLFAFLTIPLIPHRGQPLSEDRVVPFRSKNLLEVEGCHP